MHAHSRAAVRPRAGLVSWTIGMYAEDGHSVEVMLLGDTCGWGAEVSCSTSTAFDVSGSLSVCAIIAYFALYGFYLWRAWRQLAGKLYQKYRMMNIVMRLQVRPLPLASRPRPGSRRPAAALCSFLVRRCVGMVPECHVCFEQYVIEQ